MLYVLQDLGRKIRLLLPDRRVLRQHASLNTLLDFLRAPPQHVNTAQLKQLLSWMVLLRLLVLSLALGTSITALLRQGSAGSASTHAAILSIYAVSLVNILAIRYASRLLVIGYLQFAVDVLCATLAIYVSGSLVTLMLYLLVIAGAAVVFGGHGAVVIAGLSAICYSLIASGVTGPAKYPGLQMTTFEILLVYLSLVAVAVVSAILSKKIRVLGLLAEQHERDLNSLNEQQRAMLDDITEGIITLDVDATITNINEAGRLIIGLGSQLPRTIIGRPLHELLAQLGVVNADKLLGEKNYGSRAELHLQSAEGQEQTLHYLIRPVIDSDGGTSGNLFIFRDVSDIKNMEKKLSLHEQMSRLLSSITKDGEKAYGPIENVRIIGESQVMKQIFSLIHKVAASDASVLVQGESGTGKELIAQAIHAQSARAQKPFVAINCGAIPENLIESELFGHKKGSFTGAVSDTVGLFRQAHGGTLFLDEIGELPLPMQTKLLRVLQERSVRAVGDHKDIAIDVRVIAATNRDLKRGTAEGSFREDLFYRLNVISVYVPPLRRRKEDISLLVSYFIGRLCDPDQPLPTVSPEALDMLMGYAFPGNIRELENIIERALVLGGAAILPEHLPEEVRNSKAKRSYVDPSLSTSPSPETLQTQIISLPIDLESTLADIEKKYLFAALIKSNGIKKQAAELLGLNFRSLRYRLKKYDLESEHLDTKAE